MRILAAMILPFVLAACAQFGGATHLPDGGPPVVNEFYEVGSCPGEGCYAGTLRARQSTPLYERMDVASPVIGTLAPDEWVTATSAVSRLRPVRGVVFGNLEGFAAGDVVYALDYLGEGYASIWRRGEILEWYYGDATEENGIAWELESEAQRAADAAAGAGWWLRVRRENGQIGWARGEAGFDCTNLIDMSEECAERNFPEQSAAQDPPASRPLPAFRDCDECPEMAPVPDQVFAAGKYEVTFDEWDACVAAGGCGGYVPADQGWGRGRRPVINVSWDDAQAYVQWLSQRTGRAYRLPTSVEWEIAARGAMSTQYAWGNDSPSCDRAAFNGANTLFCSLQQTLPVGEFSSPNRFGLYDVEGNVAEWAQDCLQDDCVVRVLRGGLWGSEPMGVDTFTSRVPDAREAFIGFRVARGL